jgi:hypothetical protein
MIGHPDAEAKIIRVYHLQLVPGLLQTANYAEAVLLDRSRFGGHGVDVAR